MQKDSAQAKLSLKVVGGLLFLLTLYNGNCFYIFPQRVRGRDQAENEFWRILELEKTHLIDTNLSFLTFLEDLAGQIEMPRGPDCGPRAVCWTLL